MVVLALVMIGVSFAWIAPESGFAPGASATESAASPEVSTAECDPRVAGDSALPDRMYRATVGSVDKTVTEIYVRRAWEQIVACGAPTGDPNKVPAAMMTERLIDDRLAGVAPNAWVLSDDEAQAMLGWQPQDYQLDAWEAAWNEAIAANPAFQGDPLAIAPDVNSMVELVDGRVAIYSATYWLQRGGRITADPTVRVHFFAKQGDMWRYDEFVSFCVGDCAGFRESGQESRPQLVMTELAKDDRPWIRPLEYTSCDALASPINEVDVTIEASTAEVDRTAYVPFATVDANNQEAAARAYLEESDICGRLESGDLTMGEMYAEMPLGLPGAALSQVETALAITEALGYRDPMGISLWNPAPLEITAEAGVRLQSSSDILRPEDIVALPDGRLGGLVHHVYRATSGMYPLHLPYDLTVFVVFAEENGEWVVDESFAICVGKCADYWNGEIHLPSLATPNAPASTATPATNDGDQWLRPVTADECVVESRPRDEMTALISTPATIPDRAYLPAVTVDSSTELNVIAAARAWHACANYGLPSQRMALESPAYIWEQSGRTRHDDPARFEARQAATRSFSETLLDPDWTTYFIETAGVDDLAFSGQRSIVQPGHAWRLPDGRVGVVVSQLVPPGTHEERADWPEHSVEFQIFTLENDRWLLDETLWLCPGGCEVAPGVVSASPVADLPAATCMTAEVHNEPISAPWMTDDLLRNLPWIEVDTGSGDLTLLGLLWYGDRPLEPNGVFPADGMSAKLMWYSSVQIRDLRILARPVDDATSEPVQVMTNAANSAANGPSMMWPSSMALPGVGCWEITLTAMVAETGEPVTGTLIMEVVAPPASTPES
jgi:hypothetical protein